MPTHVPLRVLCSLVLGLVCMGGVFAATPQAHAALRPLRVHANPTAHGGTKRILPDPTGPNWTCTPGSCVPHAVNSPVTRLHPPDPCATLIASDGAARIRQDPNGHPWRSYCAIRRHHPVIG